MTTPSAPASQPSTQAEKHSGKPPQAKKGMPTQKDVDRWKSQERAFKEGCKP